MVPGIITAASRPKVWIVNCASSQLLCTCNVKYDNAPGSPLIVLWCNPLQLKATHMTVICKSCKHTKILACKPGMGGAMIPRYCDQGQDGGPPSDCGESPYVILPHKSTFVDQQTLKLQVRRGYSQQPYSHCCQGVAPVQSNSPAAYTPIIIAKTMQIGGIYMESIPPSMACFQCQCPCCGLLCPQVRDQLKLVRQCEYACLFQ